MVQLFQFSYVISFSYSPLQSRKLLLTYFHSDLLKHYLVNLPQYFHVIYYMFSKSTNIVSRNIMLVPFWTNINVFIISNVNSFWEVYCHNTIANISQYHYDCKLYSRTDLQIYNLIEGTDKFMNPQTILQLLVRLSVIYSILSSEFIMLSDTSRLQSMELLSYDNATLHKLSKRIPMLFGTLMSITCLYFILNPEHNIA